jgi:hypothetical protein
MRDVHRTPGPKGAAFRGRAGFATQSFCLGSEAAKLLRCLGFATQNLAPCRPEVGLPRRG